MLYFSESQNIIDAIQVFPYPRVDMGLVIVNRLTGNWEILSTEGKCWHSLHQDIPNVFLDLVNPESPIIYKTVKSG